jgi:hypothetical protein
MNIKQEGSTSYIEIMIKYYFLLKFMPRRINVYNYILYLTMLSRKQIICFEKKNITLPTVLRILEIISKVLITNQ